MPIHLWMVVSIRWWTKFISIHSNLFHSTIRKIRAGKNNQQIKNKKSLKSAPRCGSVKLGHFNHLPRRFKVFWSPMNEATKLRRRSQVSISHDGSALIGKSAGLSILMLMPLARMALCNCHISSQPRQKPCTRVCTRNPSASFPAPLWVWMKRSIYSLEAYTLEFS